MSALRSPHHVLMCFHLAGSVWRISFTQLNHWPLALTLSFASADKISDIHQRFAVSRIAEDKEAFEFALR